MDVQGRVDAPRAGEHDWTAAVLREWISHEGAAISEGRARPALAVAARAGRAPAGTGRPIREGADGQPPAECSEFADRMSRELDRPFEEVLADVNALDNEHGIALKALIRVHDEAAEGRDSFRHILERAIWRKRAPAGQGPRREGAPAASATRAAAPSAALARPAHQELDRRRRGAAGRRRRPQT